MTPHLRDVDGVLPFTHEHTETRKMWKVRCSTYGR